MFPGQVLELSMPVGEGLWGPLGYVWVQAWTDNDYLKLRALSMVLFDIITSSGKSPACVFLFSCPSVNMSCYRISSKTAGWMFLKLGQNVPLGV